MIKIICEGYSGIGIMMVTQKWISFNPLYMNNSKVEVEQNPSSVSNFSLNYKLDYHAQNSGRNLLHSLIAYWRNEYLRATGFSLSRAFWTDTGESHDSRWGKKSIFYFSLSLPPIHKHSNTYLQLSNTVYFNRTTF